MTYTVYYHNVNTNGKRLFHTEEKANCLLGICKVSVIPSTRYTLTNCFT